MKTLSLALLIPLFCQSSLAQTAETPNLNDILPLRSCAYSLSTTVEGTRIIGDWSSDQENSFYFVNCDEDFDKGQDHYVLTPSGVYYFFIKYHKDYKGGYEPTQFRLSLENQTYYFKINVAGGLGQLFDQDGNNLRTNLFDPADAHMDVSAKNPVINYYMKTLTGKSDPKASILAEPATGERLSKAQACFQQQVSRLSTSLAEVFLHRKKFKQVPPETITQYQAFVENALSNPACSVDAKTAETINELLAKIRK